MKTIEEFLSSYYKNKRINEETENEETESTAENEIKQEKRCINGRPETHECTEQGKRKNACNECQKTPPGFVNPVCAVK